MVKQDKLSLHPEPVVVRAKGNGTAELLGHGLLKLNVIAKQEPGEPVAIAKVEIENLQSIGLQAIATYNPIKSTIGHLEISILPDNKHRLPKELPMRLKVSLSDGEVIDLVVLLSFH